MRSLCRVLLSSLKTLSHATLVLICFAVSVSAQQRDASAIAFLSQAVNAAGGGNAITAVQDFTAQGSITHYWGENPERGELTIKSRGSSQFRIDSVLAEGTWSFVANNGDGEQLFPDGTSTPVALQNLLNAGSLTWPIFKVNNALSDQTTTIIDIGVAQFGSGKARHIQIQQNSAGVLSKNTKTDYFFDPSSFLILRAQDIAHPDNDAVNGGAPNILDFSNYQNVNGLLAPFAVSQSVAGQQTWSVQLSSLAFNTGLSDSDFQF
jgi:hypothetical protein